MISLNRNRIFVAAGMVLLLCAVAYLADCANAPKKRTFVRKECLDCHQEFANTYMNMKSVHEVVKEKKCEDCHLRHGIVPKLLLKEPGNQICYSCHGVEKMGLDKSVVHPGLKKGKCISCHNPHASQASYLLKAEGKEVCYECHKREDYEKQVVHEPVSKKTCTTCHLAHSSDEANLLKRNESALCISCHDSKKGAFKKAHGDYPVENSSCES